MNGFVLTPTSIPIDEVLHGGPQRDGIPALDEPLMEPADTARLDDQEWVIGVTWQGEARAYPLEILVWHELVNDTIAGRPILVSYCPLCGTGLVFDRPAGKPGSPGAEPEADRFGVSGLIYRSDMLMYDRATESLWSQISARSVTGPRTGERLSLIRSEQMRWADWQMLHPASRVMSRETGHRRPYGRSPYGDYALNRKLLFPLDQDRRYHPKMRTLGLRLASGLARAYPSEELLRLGAPLVEDFAGYSIRVSYDPESKRFQVSAPPEVEVLEAYWFAWAAFHPEASTFEAPQHEAAN